VDGIEEERTHSHVVAWKVPGPSAVAGLPADAYRGQVHAANQVGKLVSTFRALCGQYLVFSEARPGHILAEDYPVNCKHCLLALRRSQR